MPVGKKSEIALEYSGMLKNFQNGGNFDGLWRFKMSVSTG
jgi:hypothetical protein